MAHQVNEGPIEVFSTCPQSSDVDEKDYMQRVIDVARWSEQYGCRGMLVYSDNRLVDPWLVSQVILQHTRAFCPLVAVQPLYMHPYTVAKMVGSLAFLHRRRIYLNMVAGGFKNDLIALNDSTPHDKRYDRLKEYTHIIKELLIGAPVSYEGEFYRVANLKLAPRCLRICSPACSSRALQRQDWKPADPSGQPQSSIPNRREKSPYPAMGPCAPASGSALLREAKKTKRGRSRLSVFRRIEKGNSPIKWQ